MILWIKSARHALRGIQTAFREERNMKIHIFAMLSVLFLSAMVQVSEIEFSLIIVCCMFVLCVELANSASERLLDILKPRISLQLAGIKDILSGCVLIASVGAAIIGVTILGPKITSRMLHILQTGVLS